MTQDEILRMAREAGIDFQSHTGILGRKNVTTCGSTPIAKMERFAALIAAKEREACAQACVEISTDYWMGDCQFEAATRCAATIRARSNP